VWNERRIEMAIRIFISSSGDWNNTEKMTDMHRILWAEFLHPPGVMGFDIFLFHKKVGRGLTI